MKFEWGLNIFVGKSLFIIDVIDRGKMSYYYFICVLKIEEMLLLGMNDLLEICNIIYFIVRLKKGNIGKM